MPPKTNYRKKNNRKSKKTPAKPTKSFVKKVQSIIHKDAETKMAYHNVADTFFNSVINSVGDIQRVLPNVAIGTAENERIGEQIRAQKLNIKGHLTLSVSNNSYANSRVAVRMMIVCPKNRQSYSDVTVDANWQANLLNKGGSNTYFTGSISDLYAPINTDQITCFYDKLHYLSIPYIGTQSLGVPTTGFAGYAQDLRQTIKFFNISLKVKNKLLKYDKGHSTVQPTMYSPVMLIGYTHLNGGSADSVDTQVILNFDSMLHFEDM